MRASASVRARQATTCPGALTDAPPGTVEQNESLECASATGSTAANATTDHATTRFRRSEWLYMAGDIVYLGVFAFLAWGWFTLPVT